MKKILGLTILMMSFNVMAAPEKLEMIFLSPHKVSKLLDLLEKKSYSPQLLALISQNEADLKNCVPMGDGCFDPQLGYIEKKPGPEISKPAPIESAKEKEVELKTFNASETSLINCDKGNYFDIYCGKEKARGKPSEIEIWFDISSSLRTVDYNKDNDQCGRRTFMTKVMEGCKDKISISVYNTALKQVGDHSSVCMAYGTNDERRLLQWMKDSEAKKLVVVTDIDEMSTAMKNFLSERGAKMIGDGVKPFSSTDLENYANDFVKTCKN